MQHVLEPQTSETLLSRLRRSPTDQAAWGEFVDRYGPMIYDWCRRWHLQEADARDVCQDVLLRLARLMRTFSYDRAGSFRGWLKTLTRHALANFTARRKRTGAITSDPRAAGLLTTVAAHEDLVQRLEEEFDRELLERAMARVRRRVEPHTWEAFRLLALEGWPGARAAVQLHMKVATAFVARSKVQHLLREEIHRLETPDGEEGA
jgi:RNA polymerase sigma-70 factor (ECF subfamily)